MTAMAQQAGKGADQRPQHAGWSAAAARPGQEVGLCARLTGYGGEVEVTFKVFSASKDASAPLATLKAYSDATGLASTQWMIKFDAARDGDPTLFFEATTPDGMSLSPPLAIVDSVDVSLDDVDGNALAGLEVVILDQKGGLYPTKVAKDSTIQRDVPLGEFQLLIKDHQIVGEAAPGQRRFSTGKRHAITIKRMLFTVEILSPRDGDILVAGDRLPIATRVLRQGKPEDAAAGLVVSGEGRLEGGADAAQSGGGGGGDKPVLILGDQDGEVVLEASYMGAKQVARIKVIRPQVRRIELLDQDKNLVELFDHRVGRRQAPYYAFDANGNVTEAHPGAVRFGTKLKAKVYLHHDETPSRPSKLDLALVTQDLQDEGLAPCSDKKLVGKRMTFRLAADKRAEGVEVAGAWDEQAFELESDRELPACIRAHELKVEARLRVKGEAGWSGEESRPRMWAKVSQLGAISVFGVWEAPEVSDGSPQKPGASPVKETDLDAFHLGHAARWADGGWNLLPDDEGSILKRMLASIGHYEHPAGYEGKEGRPAKEHPQPDNYDVLVRPGIATGEKAPEGAPAADDKLEVEINRRGGKAEKNAATDLTAHVLTSGALRVDVEMDAKQPSAVTMHLLVDGKEKHKAELQPGKKLADIELGPVKPGPHVVTFSPEAPKGTVLASFRGKATIHFSKPKPAEAKPQDENWGFGVLDHPATPGGQPHQAASAVAAALSVLGVKAGVNMIRARENGAINLVAHDPITVGASCFDPEKHWGESLIAFAAVAVDKRRDEDALLKAKGKVRFDKALALDLRTKKIVAAEAAAITGHARRKPKRDKLVRAVCRCGQPWPPEGWLDWAARIRSGAPFTVKLNAVDVGDGQWGKIKPGASYEVRFKAPDTFISTGPTTEKVEFGASLNGAFWSFTEFPSGKAKAGHGGKEGKHRLKCDPKTGVITVALSGGRGQYQVVFYKNEKQEGPIVATCGAGAAALRLTADARKAGWKLEGRNLVPPAALVEGGLSLTAAHKDAGAVPDKQQFNIWGHPFAFDNAGNVTDPGYPEFGVVGQLVAAGVEPFGASPEIAHQTFPISMLAAFDRRYHHTFVHRVKEFETQVQTEGALRLLPAVAVAPRTMNVHFRIFVDGKLVGAQVLPGQKPAWIDAPSKKGARKIKVVALVQGHGPCKDGIEAALTVETTKAPEAIRRHPISGAQPSWAYEIDKQHKLEDALIQSIIYISPGGVTVHEEDADCWATGDKLEQRKLTEGWIL